MGQDFTKGLNVCIGNYGYYNEGSLHDAWITLPKTEAEIRDFLHLNRLQDPLHEEIYISDYDGVPFGTRLLFNEFCHLEDLNLLAKQLVTANPADLEKVLEDGYIDNCADGPDVDYYDRDELASLIGDRYDAKYPATSSKAADRSLGHKQEVSRNASELLNDGKQAMETPSQEH